MKVRKAIIPAAGLGTRFLPATKAMPKEMLPIIDKPTIQYIVEEAVNSGIEDIIIVTGKGKRAIEDHFDHSLKLEQNLLEKGNIELLHEVQQVTNLADIHYIRQKEPRGLGHAVWCARKFVGDEPFAILLGDDIVKSEVPCLQQMMQIFDQVKHPVIGVQPVEPSEVSRYGIVDAEMVGNQLYAVKHLVEKPTEEEAPSNLAIMGRYILIPEIFDLLQEQEVGTGGEIQLTDAISKLTDVHQIYAYLFDGIRYDVGEKLGFIKTTIELALQREDIGSELMPYLETVVKRFNSQ